MPERIFAKEHDGHVNELTGSESLSSPSDPKSTGPGAWSRGDYYCLAGLWGLILIVYSQLWMPGLVLIKRDAFQFFLPIKQYIIDRLSAGELPQWFPYEGLGRPLLAIPVTGVFHPFTALYWLFPVHDAYRVSTLLSCLIGAAGTYLLGRNLRLTPAGAMMAAVGFSISGYVVSLTENVVYLYSTCALPSLVFALQKALTTRRMLWHGLTAVVWASIFLNGDIQTGYYAGFISLLWAWMHAERPLIHALLRVLLIVGLTILLSGIQLAPTGVAFSQSSRTEAISFHAEAIHWSTHPLRLLTLVLSPIGDDAEGDRIAAGLFGNNGQGRGPGGFWAESLYLGLPIVGLAMLGAGRRRDLRIFTLVGTAGLLLAIGSYGGIYDLFYDWVPLWSAFRYPEKLMGLVSFAVAMLAGGGFDLMREGRTSPFPWFGVGGICLGMSALLWAEVSVTGFADATGLSRPLAIHIAAAVAKSGLWTAATAFGIGATILWMRASAVRGATVSACVIALVLLDLTRANLPVLYTASAEAWTFTPGLAEAIKNDAKGRGLEHFRVLGIKDAQADVSEQVSRTLTSRERIAVIRRQGLYLEHNATFQIESAQSYLPGNKLAFQQVGRNANLRSIARYNVAYLIGRPARFEQPHYAGSLVATVPDYDLALARNPVPVTSRAYLSRKPESYLPTSASVSFLEREDFLSGEVDVIEGLEIAASTSSQGGHAAVVEYRPEHIRVAVETLKPAVLILTDAFESGWEAKIDGGEALPIFRANGLVRAVMVPPGKFTVLFTYDTPLLRVGGWISLGGIALLLILPLMQRGLRF